MGRTRSKVYSDGKAFSRRAGKPKTSLGRRLYCVPPFCFAAFCFYYLAWLNATYSCSSSFIVVIFFIYLSSVLFLFRSFPFRLKRIKHSIQIYIQKFSKFLAQLILTLYGATRASVWQCVRLLYKKA